MDLKELLIIIIKGIVQTEEDVIIKETKGEKLHGRDVFHYTVKVNPKEFSLIIGKEGSTIKALRVLMSKLAGKQKKMLFIDTDEGKLK